MDEKSNLGVFNLAPDVTAEQMQAVFFDPNALRVPNFRLYQLNTRGTRYYYTLDDEGVPTFYPSVTTILHEVSPRNPFLEKWKAEMGLEKAEAYTQERANYGTFMHGQIEKLLVARSYDLDNLKAELAKYVEREQLPLSFVNYAEDLKKDILAFAQFVIDYDVLPLCIEQSLYSKKGYAGMIDLVCNMRVYTKDEEAKAREKKGEKWTDKDEEKYTKRIIAMVDFKSGRKGFYESHVFQLYMYKDMWEEHYPDIPIQSVFNWSPKDWRKAPSYNFECQDDAQNPRIAELLLEQYQLRKAETKSVTLVNGLIDLSEGLSENYTTLTLEELVKERSKAEKEEVEQDESPLFPDAE